MSAGSICTRTVHTATRSERAKDAAGRMSRYGVGSLVVVDLEGAPIGMITDRDIALKCVGEGLGGDARIDDIMSRPVNSVHEDTALDSALRRMAGAEIRRLVVVDDEDKLVGLLTLDDVLDLFTEEAGEIGRLLHAQAGT